MDPGSAWAARRWHWPRAIFIGHPDERRIGLTGITGTNGKTTTSYLIDSVLREAGNITAMIGTIEYHLAGEVLQAVNTTPESLDLFQTVRGVEARGGTLRHHGGFVACAGARPRVRHAFHTAVFTNLTRDHLDFHGTMEAYFAAKQLLFSRRRAAAPRFAVLNHDDARPAESNCMPRHEMRDLVWPGPKAHAARAEYRFGLSMDCTSTFSLRAAASCQWNRRWSGASTCTTFWRRGRWAVATASRRRRLRAGSRMPGGAGPLRARRRRASRFWWWWTMRIPTTRCAM